MDVEAFLSRLEDHEFILGLVDGDDFELPIGVQVGAGSGGR